MDKNGWVEFEKDKNGNIPESVKAARYTISPGGIFKWTDGHYYVVFSEINDVGYNLYNPGGTYIERKVIRVKNQPIVDYTQEERKSSQWDGSMYYGRVFYFKGDYYVYNSREPLKSSPEKAPARWYKIPEKFS